MRDGTQGEAGRGADDPPPVFSAVLHPHRSLDLHGVRLVVALVALAGTIASIPFIVLGFWPVAGFYGLDVALLWYALSTSLRDTQSYEQVVVSALELHVLKVPVNGKPQEWRFNPLWTRVQRVEHEEFGVERLMVVSRGTAVPVAQFLSPDEKARFADRLAAALAEARRGPTYNPLP